jgi:autotransporter-associated beta strand protein
MLKTPSAPRMAAVCAALALLLNMPRAEAQTSTLILAPGSNNWFNAAAWSAGVPNSPGAIAQLQLLGGSSQVAVGGAVSIEQLLLQGTGATTLQGVGPFNFATDGAGELLLQLSAVGGTAGATSSIPLQWDAAGILRIDVGAQSLLQVNGAIAAASGGVVKTGAGELRLGGNNGSWSGGLDVVEGVVVVANAQGLGAASTGATVRSGGRLVLQHSSAEPLAIDGGAVQLVNLDLTGPVAVTGSSLLHRPQNPVTLIRGQLFESTLGPTNVIGNITGSGDLTIRNESRDALYLRGANSHSGHTYIEAGGVLAMTPMALGGASEGTTINGGQLIVQAPMAERFRIESGALYFNAGEFIPADPIIVAGGDVYFPNRNIVDTPIVVDGGNGGIRGGGPATSFVGGSTGVGNLRIVNLNIDAPLAHQGALIVENVQLNVANSHTGDTIVAYTADVNHAGAFGQSQKVRIQRSELRLNVLPAGSPHYFVEGGVLIVPNSSQPITSPVTIGGGNSDAALRGAGVYEGPITVIPGLRNQIWGGTFNGPISGPGSLELGGTEPVHLNAANALEGRAWVRGGHVHMNHEQALDPYNTNVSAGTLHVNVPINAQIITNGDFFGSGNIVFNAAQEFDHPWVLHDGSLTAAAPVGMSRLITLGDQVNGGPIRIDHEWTNIHSTNVNAPITGGGDIRNIGSQLVVAGNLSGFTGRIVAERGDTIMSQLAANSFADGEIHVRGEGTLQLATSNDTKFVVDADVFLHNAHGDHRGYDGALVHSYYASEATFRGRIDVGDLGSTTSGNFSVEGKLTGNNLTHRGGGLTIKSIQDQLQGDLRIDNATLLFDGAGALTSVDAVLLENRGNIYLNKPGHNDRLADDVAIVSRGGAVSLFSNGQFAASETLGTLRMERGITQIVNSSDHGSLSSTLTIDHLDRRQGSILQLKEPGRLSTTRILNQPTEHGGMLGPWAITESGFAVLGPDNRIGTLASTTTSLPGAATTDHVNVNGDQTLTSDVTVASLRAAHPSWSVNLNGHRLTVASGGIFNGPVISGGSLTAGVDGDAELVLHNYGEMSADIVDNPSGSVALVANNGYVHLRGANTYTGGTWVVGEEDLTHASARGQLFIHNYASIPQNDRVYLDHGVYNLQNLPAGTVHLAELHVRGDSRVRSGFAQIDADLLVLESGIVSAQLTGDGAIHKQTDGVVQIGTASPNYVGTMTIDQGRVILDRTTLPQAEFHVRGGQLYFTSEGTAANHVILDGGAVTGGLSGLVEVASDSTLMHEGASRMTGTLRGSGNLTIRGRQDGRFGYHVGLFGDASQYTGNFNVESGALRIGKAGSAGAGDISVQSAGRLALHTNSDTDPPLAVSNNIHLHGGTLYGTPTGSFDGNRSPSIVHGDVVVHGEAYIGASTTGFKNKVAMPGLTLAGDVTLEDGTHVFGLSDTQHSIATGEVALVDISGRLLVGADTTWHLLSSSLSISGEIRANAPLAAIDFAGGRNQLRLKGAEFHVDAGQSLAVTVNGGTAPVNFAGTGNVLGGGGTLVGDFHVSGGASIAPGASPGVLTIDGDSTLGPGGVLQIEIGGTQPGSEYDQLNVLGHMTLDGAVLYVSFLNGFTPGPQDSFVVLRAESLSGVFANAASSIEVDGMTLPVSYRGGMVIVGAAIPEPATVSLAIVGFAVLGVRRAARTPRHAGR